MRLTSTVLLAALSLCSAGCSGGDGDSEKCGTCPEGTECNKATNTCEPVWSECPAEGCGANASCKDGNVCACLEGFSDCNQDLSLSGSDGCECSGGCDGKSCGTGSCDPAIFTSCGGATAFCDSGTCKPCPANLLNCDGVDDCEEDGPCTSGTNCSSKQKNSCGEDPVHVCLDGNCDNCPAGKLNCDGVDDCEISGESCPCDPAAKGSCPSDEQYCEGTTCTPCPSQQYNCDGVADCESPNPCG